MDNIPVFRKALGVDFEDLHPALKHHYDVAGDVVRISTGQMDEIRISTFAKLLSPILRLLNALLPYGGLNIPTQLTNSQANQHMNWIRKFEFPDKPAHIFDSVMVHAGDHLIIEYVKYGLGVELKIRVHQGKLLYISTRFVWRIGGVIIGLPGFLSLGNATIMEEGVDETHYKVDFQITHPLFGFVFGYNGKFEVR